MISPGSKVMILVGECKDLVGEVYQVHPKGYYTVIVKAHQVPKEHRHKYLVKRVRGGSFADALVPLALFPEEIEEYNSTLYTFGEQN